MVPSPHVDNRQIGVLSVTRPWANLLVSCQEPCEIRTWQIEHFRPLLIRAAKRPPFPPPGCTVAFVDLIER